MLLSNRKMMKKYLIACVSMLTIFSASCQKGGFLDTKPTADLTKDVTFADSTNTMNYLAGLYLDDGVYFPGNGTANYDFSKMCDEAEGKAPQLIGNFDKAITQGSFATILFDTTNNMWSLFYKDIQNINVFLAEVDKSPLSASMKNRVKAEARFLRVLYYSYLMKFFGGVPLVEDRVFEPEDVSDLPRGTYEACVNYSVGELDAIANSLPVSFAGLDYGRVTKGACLALKSRILLYAASPLYNGGSPATSSPLIEQTAYPTADPARWEKARLAAKAVMDLGKYSLFVDNTTPWSGSATGLGYGFYKVFITRVNNEFIFFKPLVNGKQIENIYNPKSRMGTATGYLYYPLQELVDKFPTIKGGAITDDIYNAATNPTGYNAANPYANRDPRMSATIIYNGSQYYLNSARGLASVDTYLSTPAFPNNTGDGIVTIGSNVSTTTGYWPRKMCDEYAAVVGGNNVERCLPIIRYAEILLNYAEATNETGNIAEAINTLKALRARAGITTGTNGMYGLPVGADQATARTIIRRERDIELAFEGHRFWDIRRWKAGPELDGKFMHGMEITKTAATTFTYKRINIRTRYFKNVYYYWPIPKSDVQLNPIVLQNPGYLGIPIN